MNNSPHEWLQWLRQQVEGDNPLYHMSDEEDFQFAWSELSIYIFPMEIGHEN